METGSGSGPDDLTHFRQLTEDPTRYHLFHALRVIEARYRDAPRLGESRTAAQDRVRLGQVPELAFPPTTLTGFQPDSEGKPARLSNLFFGLWGPHGPLPLHMTEYARDRLRNHRDPTLVAFADMLTHRVMSLFYRVWASAQPAPAFDRAWQSLAEEAEALLRDMDLHAAEPDALADEAGMSFGQADAASQGPNAAPSGPLIPEDAFDDWALPQVPVGGAISAAAAEPDAAPLPPAEDDDFERTVIIPRSRAAQPAPSAEHAASQVTTGAGDPSPSGPSEGHDAMPKAATSSSAGIVQGVETSRSDTLAFDPFAADGPSQGLSPAADGGDAAVRAGQSGGAQAHGARPEDALTKPAGAQDARPDDERTVIPFPRLAQRGAMRAEPNALPASRPNPFGAEPDAPRPQPASAPGGAAAQSVASPSMPPQDADPFALSHTRSEAGTAEPASRHPAVPQDEWGAAATEAEAPSLNDGRPLAEGVSRTDPFGEQPRQPLAERHSADPAIYAPAQGSGKGKLGPAAAAFALRPIVEAETSEALPTEQDAAQSIDFAGVVDRAAAAPSDLASGDAAASADLTASSFDAPLDQPSYGASDHADAGSASAQSASHREGADLAEPDLTTAGGKAFAPADAALDPQIAKAAPQGGDVADLLPDILKTFTFQLKPRPKPGGHLDLSKDNLQRQVAALSGFADTTMLGADAMPDLSKRFFAGLLSSGPKNAEGLRAILEHFFEAKFTIQQFVGQWLTLEKDDTWQLGRTALGRGTSVGRKVWSRDSKFRIQIGPLDLNDYQRLLPGRGAIERMEAIVRNYVGDRLAWDVQLILKAEQVPQARLGTNVGLGYNSWMGSRIGTHRDADDLILTPPSQTKAARALAGH